MISGQVACHWSDYINRMLCFHVQVSWRMPGVYVPQLGDEVVYLQVGHRKFLSDNNNKLQGPWDSIVSTLVSQNSYLGGLLRHQVMTSHRWCCMTLPMQAVPLLSMFSLLQADVVSRDLVWVLTAARKLIVQACCPMITLLRLSLH